MIKNSPAVFQKPVTIEEWEAYVGGLSGSVLFGQTTNANSQDFINVLMAEGVSMQDILRILVRFVRQAKATDTMLPIGGCFDLAYLAETDLVASEGPTMTGEEAAELDMEPPIFDTVDDFVSEEDSRMARESTDRRVLDSRLKHTRP